MDYPSQPIYTIWAKSVQISSIGSIQSVQFSKKAEEMNQYIFTSHPLDRESTGP